MGAPRREGREPERPGEPRDAAREGDCYAAGRHMVIGGCGPVKKNLTCDSPHLRIPSTWRQHICDPRPSLRSPTLSRLRRGHRPTKLPCLQGSHMGRITPTKRMCVDDRCHSEEGARPELAGTRGGPCADRISFGNGRGFSRQSQSQPGGRCAHPADSSLGARALVHPGRIRGVRLPQSVFKNLPRACFPESVFKNRRLRVQADPAALSFRGPATP
jgi:hypothetical protein